MKRKLVLKLEVRSLRLLPIVTIASAALLSLILYPAVWNSALGGMLEKIIPPQIYSAIHELRHLWGIPCH